MSVSFGVAEPGSVKSPRKSVLIRPNGKIAVAYDEVTPAEHASQIIDDLDSMS